MRWWVYVVMWTLVGCTKQQKELPPVRVMTLITVADGFDFPVGAPNASGYYNAQIFGNPYYDPDDGHFWGYHLG